MYHSKTEEIILIIQSLMELGKNVSPNHSYGGSGEFKNDTQKCIYVAFPRDFGVRPTTNNCFFCKM